MPLKINRIIFYLLLLVVIGFFVFWGVSEFYNNRKVYQGTFVFSQEGEDYGHIC